MKTHMIGVPVFYGADKKSPDKGPDTLRAMKINEVFERHSDTFVDKGNIPVEAVSDQDKYNWHPRIKYFEPIVNYNRALAASVYQSIQEGAVPVTIGGDHSLAIGSISGAAKACPNLAVLWLDAHGDLNTPATSDSHNAHGMPLSFLIGEEKNELSEIEFSGPKVQCENLFMLGQRDLDAGEKEIIQRNNIQVYPVEALRQQGIDDILDHIFRQLKEKKIDALHVSFDIDFIDKAIVPGTGTPVEGGVDIKECKQILKRIMASGLVASVDVVELNPGLDIDGKTCEQTFELIDWTLSHLKTAQRLTV